MTQSLDSANFYIGQLTNKLKDIKSEKSHLNEELESKNRLIQKVGCYVFLKFDFRWFLAEDPLFVITVSRRDS